MKWSQWHSSKCSNLLACLLQGFHGILSLCLTRVCESISVLISGTVWKTLPTVKIIRSSIFTFLFYQMILSPIALLTFRDLESRFRDWKVRGDSLGFVTALTANSRTVVRNDRERSRRVPFTQWPQWSHFQSWNTVQNHKEEVDVDTTQRSYSDFLSFTCTHVCSPFFAVSSHAHIGLSTTTLRTQSPHHPQELSCCPLENMFFTLKSLVI